MMAYSTVEAPRSGSCALSSRPGSTVPDGSSAVTISSDGSSEAGAVVRVMTDMMSLSLIRAPGRGSWTGRTVVRPGLMGRRGCNGVAHPSRSGMSPMSTGTMPQHTKAGREHSPSGTMRCTDSRSAAASARRCSERRT